MTTGASNLIQIINPVGRDLGTSNVMTDPLDNAKRQLRETVHAAVQQLAAPTRVAAATELCARLRSLEIWRTAQSILMFAPLADEPDLWPLLREGITLGKTMALPSYVPETGIYMARRIVDLERDVVAGQFGIREAANGCAEIPLNQLDLVLVPGVAFDARGGRLGRGKGFYDRLLAGGRGTKCGVAFDEQIVATVPMGPRDISLNCILTPTRWIET
jgi:5-formyltetrahydrofolate cyclo-ligase